MTTALTSPAIGDRTGTGPRVTRVGAGLGLAGVVLVIAGFALVAPAGAVHTGAAADVVAFYTEGDPTVKYAGGLIESVGLLLLLPFAAMLAARLHGPDVAGLLLAPVARATLALYVAFSLAPGQAAGAAALWLGHSPDADPAVLLALNDLRVFSYYLALLCLASFLGTVGLAGVLSGRLPRWVAWSAVVIGSLQAAGVAAASTGAADAVSLLSLTWIVVTAVRLLTGSAARRAEPNRA
jgi:hypothetical protein